MQRWSARFEVLACVSVVIDLFVVGITDKNRAKREISIGVRACRFLVGSDGVGVDDSSLVRKRKCCLVKAVVGLGDGQQQGDQEAESMSVTVCLPEIGSLSVQNKGNLRKPDSSLDRKRKRCAATVSKADRD